MFICKTFLRRGKCSGVIVLFYICAHAWLCFIWHIISGCFLSAVPFDNYRLPAQSSRYITYQWEMSVLTMFEDQWKSLYERSSTASSKICLHTVLVLRSVNVIKDVTDDVIRVSWVKKDSWIGVKNQQVIGGFGRNKIQLPLYYTCKQCAWRNILQRRYRRKYWQNGALFGSTVLFISSLKQFWQQTVDVKKYLVTNSCIISSNHFLFEVRQIQHFIHF